jgi:hypothetical protein
MTIQELTQSPLRKTVSIIASGKLVGITNEDYLKLHSLALSLGFTGCGRGCSRRIYVFLDAKCKEVEESVTAEAQAAVESIQVANDEEVPETPKKSKK